MSGQVQSLDTDRRKFQRFSLEASVKLYSVESSWETELLDVSLKGVLIRRPDHWNGEEGQTCRLEITLPGNIFISMGVAVKYVSEDQIGCICEKIDFDSFTRLKRLIELNLGDPSMLNRELSQLG